MTSIKERLQESLQGATPAGRNIANYMLANLTDLPFETAASVARKIGVSELTVGRFCRGLGFRHFKDLKTLLKADLGDSPWLVGDRLRDFEGRSRKGNNEQARGLEMEISAIVRVHEIIQTPDFARFVKRLSTRKRVMCAGFQTERGIAALLAHQLQYLRDGVTLVDMTGGNFVDVLLSDPEEIMLVVLDTRRYSRLSHMLAVDAKALGIPVTVISDAFCDWSPSQADEVFMVPTTLNHFWDSLGPMVSLVQLTVNAVFSELGAGVEERLNRMAQCYSRYTGYSTAIPKPPEADRTYPDKA